MESNDTIKILTEIAIVLLLFEVGLETDISKLIKAGKSAFTSARLGVAAPFILGFCLSYYIFDFALMTALFVGASLTAARIGIALRVLSDLKRNGKHETKFIRWSVGLAMILRGEVGLIFAELVKSTGVFNNEIYTSMIIVIAITTIAAPIFLRLFYHHQKQMNLT